MTEKEFVEKCEEFARQLAADRNTETFGMAIFALLYKAVLAGRTKEMFVLVKDFGDDLRGTADWPELLL